MTGIILVVGAMGGIGRSVTRKLVENGERLRALVRDTSQTRPVFGNRVDFVLADLRDKESLIPAFEGVDRVICVAGAKPPLKPDNAPEQVDYGGVRTLVELAQSGGIEHVVLVSSVGVTQPSHPLNAMFGNVLQWKLRGEDTLRASGVPYTIVRPGGLTDDHGGKGIQFAQGDTLSGRICREDVAEVCVQALSEPEARGVTFEIVESSDPHPIDWRTVFATMRRDNRW